MSHVRDKPLRFGIVKPSPVDTYIVTAEEDGSIGINALCVAKLDGRADEKRVRILIERANAAPAMYEALRKAERLAWEVGCETEDGVKTILEDARGDLWREITAVLERYA
jgi:hypothetical protein